MADTALHTVETTRAGDRERPIMGWGIGVVSHAIPIWTQGSMSPARIA
ncbi:hypothetical protein VST63_21775 [Mycolicibacterium sp. 050232]|nr:hypothetical protein [Mycolicibacterium sp. 050232]MED5814997.1 hypothetical protein [Mycolicibacterium sp. 050232]